MPSIEAVLKECGIVANPTDVIIAAKNAKLPLDINTAKLLKESSGGKNVFGNDRVKYPTRGAYTADTVWVTLEACKAYLKWRNGGKGRANGVGPSQLTYYVFQDQAEKLGGLHIPEINMRVGAIEMARCLKAAGGDIAEAGARYNGGDRWRSAAPAKREFARKYGLDLLSKTITIRRALQGASTETSTAPGSPSQSPKTDVARNRTSLILMTT